MNINNKVALDFDDVVIRPKPSIVNSRKDVDLKVNYDNVYTGIPVVVSPMTTTGTISMAQRLHAKAFNVGIHRYYDVEILREFFQTKDAEHSWMTIGPTDDELSRYNEVSHWCPRLIVDTANGYTAKYVDFIKHICYKYPDTIIVAGNVCTPEGCENLIEAGAHIIRCGLSWGSACTTRHKTAIGLPTFQTILDCKDICKEKGVLLMADGGIRCVADICKSLAAGANVVLCGGLFAGYNENEVEWWYKDGENHPYMTFYGMSSKLANDRYNGGLKDYRAAEGCELEIKHKGNIGELLQDIEGGLASCCTYTNSQSVYRLGFGSQFNRIR